MKFNGKNYILVDKGYPNIFKAKSAANKQRANGYNARVVKMANGYAVYRRHKS